MEPSPISPNNSYAPSDPLDNRPSAITAQTLTYRLVIIVLSIFLVLALSGSIFFYIQNQSLKKKLLLQSIPEKSTTNVVQPTPTVYSTNNRETFKVSQLDLSFELPSKMSSLGNWGTEIIPSDTGNNICFHLFQSAKAGGVGFCSGKYFTINSVSGDFTAARGGSFADTSGYRTIDGKYYLGLDRWEGEQPFTTNQAKEFTTSKGIKYLRITGDDVGLLLSSGYIGALINTGNQQYPGIVVIMDISDQFTQSDFTQILDSFQFGNRL